MSADLAAIANTTGHDPRGIHKLPVVPAYRDRHLTAWPALYGWLRDQVSETPGILLQEGKSVAHVRAFGDKAGLSFEEGTQLVADAAPWLLRLREQWQWVTALGGVSRR